MRIGTVLVANRGEVVSRVARTARSLGIRVAAVYTDSDARAPYLSDADVAVPLGPDRNPTPYLDITALISAARAAGADAVHPGYGFLAENADFAEACTTAGLIWIGPDPDVIRTMGLKIEAKETAKRVGVRVLESVTVTAGDGDVEAALIASASLSPPLLVKPSAGGGGKGIHRVESAADLGSVLLSARREAEAAFGDGTLFVERCIEAPRHIEVQVFADRHGTVVHLGERDCSVQRRHQKVLEEAPATNLSGALRNELTAAAVRLAREIGYVGAGTVEFLVFDGEYAFLEMNTRLQVEHTVTEQVTSLDLVELQFLVAEGHALPTGVGDTEPRGHAIEARLYAEDPADNFLPSPGTIRALDCPDLPGIRWELGVRAGSEVNSRYDPMIAKVVATGRDRRQAIARLRGALQAMTLVGVRTNRAMLVAVLNSDEYANGPVGTDFLARRPDLLAIKDSEVDCARAAVAAAVYARLAQHAAAEIQPFTPLGWRNLRSQDDSLILDVDGHAVDVRMRAERNGTWVTGIDAARWFTRVYAADAHSIDVEIDGLRHRYLVDRPDEGVLVVANSDGVVTFRLRNHASAQERAVSASSYTAPLPGKVVAVEVTEGEMVASGAELLVVEAMKMEHRIRASTAGRVKRLLVAVGDSVEYQQALLELSDEGAQ